MKEEIGKIVSAFHPPPPSIGLVVGVVERGRQTIFGYGQAGNAGSEPPGGDTLFEIGSITKLFTTTLLATIAADGFLNLDDPVRDLVPGLSNLPPEITLLRLATHTAGLPQMPSNIFRSMLRDRHNPHAAYTTADLLAYLSNHKPRRQRIGQIKYSNLGLALLGYILAQRVGVSYEQAVIGRICHPLNLPDTRITLTLEQKRRLAKPHSAAGKPGHNWDLPAFAGAGALHATADDMLKFLAANMGRPVTTLTEVMQTCHREIVNFPPPGQWPALMAKLFPGRASSDHHQSIGLGWFVGRLRSGDQVHWHHGATGGYRAFAGFIKETGAGVVVLANRGPGKSDLLTNMTSADGIGFKVLEYLNRAGDSGR